MDEQSVCCPNVWRAVKYAHVKCAEYYINQRDFNVDALHNGYTILHMAVLSSLPSIVARLIELSADVNATCLSDPPLFFVVDKEVDLLIARKLIANGARRCNGLSNMNHVFKSYDAYRFHVMTVLLCKYAPATCPDVVRFIAKHLWSMRLEYLNNE